MFRNRSASSHSFAMVPRADIPRSSFRMQKTYKTTFDAGYLVPFMVEEVLPGDTWRTKVTCFARLATPIFPFMDNLHFETFFFFVPNRILWANWRKFMGEQDAPGASIAFTIPQLVSAAGGFPIGSVQDYMGLPTVGQVGGGNTISCSALPVRAYYKIWDEWFRDQNLDTAILPSTGDGPDAVLAGGALVRRRKRHDYFTSGLPFTQKGSAITLPLTGNATVKPNATALLSGAQPAMLALTSAGGALAGSRAVSTNAAGTAIEGSTTVTAPTAAGMYFSNLYADLSTVTATTINTLRQSFQIQKLLERDARGGTRYTEIVRAHFGVVSPDGRLQRPEYLGGGHQLISVNPVAQTSGTSASGTTTPLANLAGFGTMVAHNHGFVQSFTEHGYIIGLCNVRADLTYQQGMRRHWSRLTRYDFYFPAFAHLGEQAVLNKEIYADGSANDNVAFCFQERWAEYRYNPSEITGLFRSTAAGTIDPWHLSQRFTGVPSLNATFMMDTPPLSRVLAVGAAANGQQLLMDCFFDNVVARPMPVYSVPGMVDRF